MNRRTFLGQAALAYGAFLLNARAQGTSRAPKLKIREIRAVRLRDGFNSRFVRVYTDQGLTGTGETMDTVGAEDIINNNIGPALVGRDPLDIEGILSDLWGWRRGPGGGAPSPLFMRGMGGPYFSAMSGVEMALWDLAGKAMDVPVYRLLGGRVRERVPVYLHAATPAEATALVAQTKVKALKVGIDYSPDAWTLKKGYDPDKLWGLHLNTAQLDDVVNFAASFRDALGKDYDFALECHARYDVETGIQLCRLLEPLRLIWVEEPIPSDDVDAMLRIRTSTRVPIAAGENIYSRYGYRPFLEKEALSIIQPDMSKTGGLLESRKIAAMAETYAIPVAPHGVASPLATMAYAQVCVTIPNFMLLEWTHYLNKLYTSLTEPVALEDGYLRVRDTPGIGVALNEEAVKERTDAGLRPL
ncbi:MAG TPA: mandelate racemase/muconate lactonizing enzyme family protein [Acidobacteriaceae bacterium]|nr:mandelate racemase/muconate lactonizing enzyme family protein [Acidobacteriaceae bacterium]